MSYPAELATAGMEKAAIGLAAAALIALGIAPTVTWGLNKLTGHDPKKKIEEQKEKLKQELTQPPQLQPQAPIAGQQLTKPAQGLHSYRTGA